MPTDGPDKAGAAAPPPRARRALLSRSLNAKFIATVVPIFLMVFGTCVVADVWFSYHSARQEILQRLDKLAASQSIILAECVATRDTKKLNLLLASVIDDPDLVGIAVRDEKGELLDYFGDLETSNEDFQKTITVNYSDGAEVRRVGTLRLVMTDENLRHGIVHRLVEHTLLGIALLAASVFASVFAHRRAVGKPLAKLLSAIEESRGGALEKVDWQSDDEIGRVIASYNEMLTRLASYERELESIKKQLENRVEERTTDLVTMREQAEEANRVKSKFLSSMSHEFRTPMNAIQGFTQVLLMSPDVIENPRLLDRLTKIHNSSKSLMALLDEIMVFTQLETTADDAQIENLSPAEVVFEAAALVEPLAESRQVHLSVADDIGSTGEIRADRGRLRKALLNLLTNAVKYNHPGGRVDVACENLGDRVAISVRDTGEGIPAGQADAVFEPFNRLGREAGNIEGSGIGLTITQRITETMGGEIDFESVEGEGSTFRLIFPAAGAA